MRLLARLPTPLSCRPRRRSRHPRPLTLALVALLSAAILPLVVVSAASRADDHDESAQVLMPFDGQWANDFGTAPWEHGRILGEDWTMDVFAPGTDVHARIGNVTGDLRLEVSPPEPYGCVNGGSMVWIRVIVDGVDVGRFGYHHLTDIEYPAGITLDGVDDVRIGRTATSPFAFGGGCWNVSTDNGIHAHLVLDNATGFSCYVRYEKGQRLDRDQPLAVMGGADGRAWATAPRSECPAGALDVGSPLSDDTSDDALGAESPYVFRSLDRNAFVNDFQLAVHPISGRTLVGWHEFEESGGTEHSRVQILRPSAVPAGASTELTPSAGASSVRFDDVLGRTDTDGWIVLHDDGAGATRGERLVLRHLNPDGTPVGAGRPVDDGPSLIGRLARDPVDGTVVIAWTRPAGTGFEVVVARYDAAALTEVDPPFVAQTGEPGQGLGVEDLAIDPVTGSVYLFTQSGIVAGDGLLALERSVVRLSPGGNTARHVVDQPVGTSFSQASGAVDATGTLYLATHLVAVDGSTTTRYESWSPGSVAPTASVGPTSTERPTVLARPDGGFDVLHTVVVGEHERLHVTTRQRDGQLGSARIVSSPIHERAALGDMRVDRSPIDGSLTIVTRERLDQRIRLASAHDRFGLPVTAPAAARNVVVVADAVPDFRPAAPGAALTVTWDEPATDGGAPITSYELRAAPNNVRVTVSAEARSARITGLTGDLDHTVVVTAINEAGPGPQSPPVNVFVPVRPREGYWMLEADGTVHGFGDAANLGDAPIASSSATALVPLPGGDGYWVLDSSGIVHAFGTASHMGDLISEAVALRADERATTMAATPAGDGYWIFTDRGRAVAFGAAGHHGDVAHLDLNGPIIDSVATPSGAGYFQIGADGGIFASGDAAFHGSIQSVVDQLAPGTAARDWLAAPIVGLVPTPSGAGYWLVASDGGTFAFGDATFRGSVPAVLPGVTLNAPINGMVAYGDGYLMVASDGGVFTFSNLAFLGSLGDQALDTSITAIAPIND